MEFYNLYDYNFEEVEDPLRYYEFSSESEEEFKNIRKSFTSRDLEQNTSPKMLFEHLNEVPGLENRVKGYRVSRDTNALGNLRWHFKVYLKYPRKNLGGKVNSRALAKSKNKKGKEKAIKNHTG